MRPELTSYYTGEILRKWLEGLANKFPLQPLSAVLQNYLLMSDDGTEVTRLALLGAGFYEMIKQLETMPDQEADKKLIPVSKPFPGAQINLSPVALGPVKGKSPVSIIPPGKMLKSDGAELPTMIVKLPE